MKNSKNRVVASGPHRRQARPPLTPELLPSPSDELFAGAAHSRGCASGNTLAPASRGITLPWLTSVVGNRVSPVFRRLRGCLKSPIRQLKLVSVGKGRWGATEQNAELRILLQIQSPIKSRVTEFRHSSILERQELCGLSDSGFYLRFFPISCPSIRRNGRRSSAIRLSVR